MKGELGMEVTPKQATEMLRELQLNCYCISDSGKIIPYGGCLFNCSIDLAVDALSKVDDKEDSTSGLLQREKERIYCQHAHKLDGGKCEGLATSIDNDEPPEMCKRCEKYYLFDED